MKATLNSLLTLIYSDDGSVFSIVGSAKVKDPAEPAKLEVSFYESNPLSLKIILNIHFFRGTPPALMLQSLRQPLPLVPTGCCPQTTRVTLWSTAAHSLAPSAPNCPGSWAESPPCPWRPWNNCIASCPLLGSTWTKWSQPIRMRLTAGLWTSSFTGLMYEEILNKP